MFNTMTHACTEKKCLKSRDEVVHKIKHTIIIDATIIVNLITLYKYSKYS